LIDLLLMKGYSMSETEWLAATDPWQMLEFLKGR
jgi:hypothetical protein